MASLCPKCGGGWSRERSYNEYSPRPGVIAGKCHRASCGYFKPPKAGKLTNKNLEKRMTDELSRNVPIAWEKAFFGNYGLTTKDYPLWLNTTKECLTYAVIGYDNNRIGYINRWLFNADGSKRKAFKTLVLDSSVPFIGFAGARTGKTAIIVEDIASALVLSKMFPDTLCVHLNGCNMTDEIAAYLKSKRVSRVILMLDGDAALLASKYTRRYRTMGMFQMFEPVYLPVGIDPKHLACEENWQLKEEIIRQVRALMQKRVA